MDAGRQLLLSADAQAEALLQEELTDLQEAWRGASVHLDQRKKELLNLLKVKFALFTPDYLGTNKIKVLSKNI